MEANGGIFNSQTINSPDSKIKLITPNQLMLFLFILFLALLLLSGCCNENEHFKLLGKFLNSFFLLRTKFYNNFLSQKNILFYSIKYFN